MLWIFRLPVSVEIDAAASTAENPGARPAEAVLGARHRSDGFTLDYPVPFRRTRKPYFMSDLIPPETPISPFPFPQGKGGAGSPTPRNPRLPPPEGF